MKTNNKLFLKNKYDYLELSLKISELRYYDKEVPTDLLNRPGFSGDQVN